MSLGQSAVAFLGSKVSMNFDNDREGTLGSITMALSQVMGTFPMVCRRKIPSHTPWESFPRSTLTKSLGTLPRLHGNVSCLKKCIRTEPSLLMLLSMVDRKQVNPDFRILGDDPVEQPWITPMFITSGKI